MSVIRRPLSAGNWIVGVPKSFARITLKVIWALRLSKNIHLSRFHLGYPHPSSLRRTSMYASFLRISSPALRAAQSSTLRVGSPVSEALDLDIFDQSLKGWFFNSLVRSQYSAGDFDPHAIKKPTEVRWKIYPRAGALNEYGECRLIQELIGGRSHAVSRGKYPTSIKA